VARAPAANGATKNGTVPKTTGTVSKAAIAAAKVAAAAKTLNSNQLKRKLPDPGNGAPNAKRQRVDDEYDYEDGFIDDSDFGTDDNVYRSGAVVSEFIRGLNFSRGPTSIEDYRKLDPKYDPEHPEMHHQSGLDDDDDGCMEVNSFMDHIEMDAKTAKKAIEEDKKEREDEKKQQLQDANKKAAKGKQAAGAQKQTSAPKPKPPVSQKFTKSAKSASLPVGPPKEWID